MPVQTQLQQRRGTAASWTSTNPTLAAGEIGFETDTGKFKIGNGSTAWAALAYSAGATAVTYLFNATSGQTTFSGADANGLTLAYTVGAEQVYLNGVLQVRGSDYTATNGTSIVLASGALTSDVLNVIAYSAMTITDTYTQAQADAKFVQVLNTPNPSNPVLNSAFQIWQRGTSVAGVTAVNYTADRWIGFRSGSTISRQTTGDTTNLPNIQYCARIQRDSGTTGTSVIIFQQPFETINSIPFAGKTVTLSYYARKGANYSSNLDVLTAQVYTGTGTDQTQVGSYTGVAAPISTNPVLTTTWQRFTATGTIAATATELTVDFRFTPVGTAGANDYFEVTGVQLEVGSVATPFRTYGGTLAGELAACQRYYIRLNSGNTGIASTFGMGYAGSTTTARIFIPLPVPMRRTGSNYLTLDYSSIRLQDDNTSYTLGTLSLPNYQDGGNGQVVIATSTGMTQYRPMELDTTNGGYVGFSAEL